MCCKAPRKATKLNKLTEASPIELSIGLVPGEEDARMEYPTEDAVYFWG